MGECFIYSILHVNIVHVYTVHVHVYTVHVYTCILILQVHVHV